MYILTLICFYLLCLAFTISRLPLSLNPSIMNQLNSAVTWGRHVHTWDQRDADTSAELAFWSPVIAPYESFKQTDDQSNRHLSTTLKI